MRLVPGGEAGPILGSTAPGGSELKTEASNNLRFSASFSSLMAWRSSSCAAWCCFFSSASAALFSARVSGFLSAEVLDLLKSLPASEGAVRGVRVPEDEKVSHSDDASESVIHSYSSSEAGRDPR